MGQHRIGKASLHRDDIGRFGFGGVRADHLEHLRLHVFGVDLPRRPHPPGELQTHVAGARADVGDGHAGLQIQRVERAFGILFLLALRPLQPGFAPAESANPGDLASGKRMDARSLLQGA